MLTSLVDLLLFPVYLYQGKSVRQNIEMLPEPEGEREGTAGTGEPIHLLIVGDSSAAGVGASTQEEALLGNVLKNLADNYNVTFRLQARTGARTRNVIKSLNRLSEESYDIAVSVLGVNDVTAGISESKWLSDQRELFSLLRQKFKVRHIVVSGLPTVSEFPALPQPLRWLLGRRARAFSKALERLCEQEECRFISPSSIDADTSQMASDGFHPGPDIYRALGQEIAMGIKSIQTQNS